MISESTQESNSGGIKSADDEFSVKDSSNVSDESPLTSSFAPSAITGTPNPIFTDVASTAGIDFQHFRSNDYFSLGAGVAIIDFNNDNLLDIYLTNSAGSNALYRNDGGMMFSNIAVSAGVDDPLGNSNGVCSGDYDNDGHVDLFLANYGTSKLFHNEGNEQFTDVTTVAEVGDPDSSYRSMGCAFGDYNEDGYLDLILVRYLHDIPVNGIPLDRDNGILGVSFTESVRPLSLWTNDGDGTFTDDTTLLGDPTANPSPIQRAGFEPIFLDYDNDGDLDIHTCNDFDTELGPNVLWQNNGPGLDGWTLFTDVSETAGIEVTSFCMGDVVGDYDNNGFLDLYHPDGGPNDLLKNAGGAFSEATSEAGVGRNPAPSPGAINIGWGGMFFDFDNDGDLDLYFVAGLLDNNAFNNFQPNALFENNDDLTFTDISVQSGADDDGIGRGGAFGDFNNDGCIDMVVGNLGTYDSIPGLTGDPHTVTGIPLLYQNNCENSNNWIIIKTVGTISNVDGIGARVKLTTIYGDQIREVAAGGSHISQNMLPVHFGLYDATQADIEITWPSGVVQTLTNIAPNQILPVVEPNPNTDNDDNGGDVQNKAFITGTCGITAEPEITTIPDDFINYVPSADMEITYTNTGNAPGEVTAERTNCTNDAGLDRACTVKYSNGGLSFADKTLFPEPGFALLADSIAGGEAFTRDYQVRMEIADPQVVQQDIDDMSKQKFVVTASIECSRDEGGNPVQVCPAFSNNENGSCFCEIDDSQVGTGGSCPDPFFE